MELAKKIELHATMKFEVDEEDTIPKIWGEDEENDIERGKPQVLNLTEEEEDIK